MTAHEAADTVRAALETQKVLPECRVERVAALAALDVLVAAAEDYDHLRSEYDFNHWRGDHLVYESEWQAFDAWQRNPDARAEAAEARADTAERERDKWSEIASGETLAKVVAEERAEAAEARADTLEAALRWIAKQQQSTLGVLRANGIVFDDIGNDPGNWQHAAFTIYTDLCKVDSVARAALDAAGREKP